MTIITNGMLFELWRQQKHPFSATTYNMRKLFLNYIRKQFRNQWPSDNHTFIKDLENVLLVFCSTLHSKWKRSVQGGGTSNTGNVARRFFSNPEKVSKTTGVSEELVQRFGIILTVIASGHELNHDIFKTYTKETAELFVSKYGWYRMPVSVHKVLFHGPQAAKSMLLPIGMLSEEALEASNKNYRRFREHHTRKSSRENTTRDLFQMLLALSDPVISKIRAPIHKRGCKMLGKEACALLKSTGNEKEDEENISEDNEED